MFSFCCFFFFPFLFNHFYLLHGVHASNSFMDPDHHCRSSTTSREHFQSCVVNAMRATQLNAPLFFLVEHAEGMVSPWAHIRDAGHHQAQMIDVQLKQWVVHEPVSSIIIAQCAQQQHNTQNAQRDARGHSSFSH